MDILLYLIPFLLSFSISTVLMAFSVLLIRRYCHSDRNISRVKRFGGASIIMAFIIAVFLNRDLEWSWPLIGLCVLSISILIFGLLDDWWEYSAVTQLSFQIILGLSLFLFHARILSLPVPFVGTVFLDTLPFGSIIGFLVVLFWVLLLVNAFNWADGVDGLLGVTSSIGCIVIFCISLRPEVYQPSIAILAALLFGTTISFLIFNAPPARIFAGTSGAFFLGFAIASLSVFSGTKIATAMLSLALPIADAIWVIGERIAAGVSPFRGNDARHLHYRLREIGWSDRKIVAVYSCCMAIAAIIALRTESLGKFLAIIAVGILLIFFLRMIARKSQIFSGFRL